MKKGDFICSLMYLSPVPLSQVLKHFFPASRLCLAAHSTSASPASPRGTQPAPLHHTQGHRCPHRAAPTWPLPVTPSRVPQRSLTCAVCPLPCFMSPEVFPGRACGAHRLGPSHGSIDSCTPPPCSPETTSPAPHPGSPPRPPWLLVA